MIEIPHAGWIDRTDGCMKEGRCAYGVNVVKIVYRQGELENLTVATTLRGVSKRKGDLK